MSTSNAERIRYLRCQVNHLAAMIEHRNLQGMYLHFLELVARGEETVAPVTESEWELLLAEERKGQLFSYYHRLRTELLQLLRTASDQSSQDQRRNWLDDIWVKRALTAVALVKAAEFIFQLAQTTGLFLHATDESVRARGPDEDD